MSIIGVIYSNQKVSAADHAKLFQMLIGDGILNGCSASARLNTFTISEGKFITAGRVAKIQGSEVITISGEYGTGWYARVKLVNDLSQAAEIDEFKQVKFEVDYAESIASFPEITQENINEDGSTGKYEIVWAILTLGENGVITSYDVKVGPASGGGGGGTGQPIFTFTPSDGTTGGYTIIDDDNGDWRIKFLKSGTLVFTNLGNASNGIDIFLVGGGGGSSIYGTSSYAGGGGGYTITSTAFIPSVGTEYPIVVGNGGAPGQNGESTIAFGYTAEGGKTGNVQNGGNGGSGGGSGSNNTTSEAIRDHDGGSVGGSDGGNGEYFEAHYQGSHWKYNGGTGQGYTTKEFKESSGALYAGGGAGLRYKLSNDQIVSWAAVSGGNGGGGNSNANANGDNGAVNTGGGGGAPNGSGGSGIVIIRNHRSNSAA